MRGWRLALLVASVLVAVAGVVQAVAVNVATVDIGRWFPTMQRYPVLWTVGGLLGVAGAGLLWLWAQRSYDRGLAELVPVAQRLEPWVVDRPAELNEIVAAVCSRDGGTVGVTTAVRGAGGFGKTTVARMVRADRRVLRRFRNRVYWVTLGRDAGSEVLAGLVNGLIAQLGPDRPVTFTDARQAGEHLAAVLAKGPRRLVIVDDVWTEEQLGAFPVAGPCVRLVTTRIPSFCAGAAVHVEVDQMSDAQALAVLGYGLPRVPRKITRGLVEETGRWPLLLRLVNKILAGQSRLHADIAPVAWDLLTRLRESGVLQVDELAGTAGQPLDVADPGQRSRAVGATIEASTGLLPAADRARLAELGVFAEDEAVPVTLVAALWHVTAGLDQASSELLCARLADLALVTLTRTGDGGTIELHDVIREYLRRQLGPGQLARTHQVLLDAAAAGLPAAAPAGAGGGQGAGAAWWELPGQARYLRGHLVEHLIAAGRPAEAEAVACDLRWARSRLDQAGPAAPAADLALIGTPRAERLARLLRRAAHLLAPTDPPHFLTGILYSRVAHDPDWGPQARVLQDASAQPALVTRRPLPDLPDPAVQQILAGHHGPVTALAVAPDGTWLATADSGDEVVRVWDIATGQQRAAFTASRRRVLAVTIAEDGSWLAAGSEDGSVRIWDVVTGQQRAALAGRLDWFEAVAVAPDGTWAAAGSRDGSVRVWDIATGDQRAVLTGHGSPVHALAASPDGSWLAWGSEDGSVRIWDAVTGRQRGALAAGHPVMALAVAPDGSWLATAGGSAVRTWDIASGQPRADLTGQRFPAVAVAVTPDGSWLATVSAGGTVQIWDAATGQQRAALAHRGWVWVVAVAPDGSWLATGGGDGRVQIWDTVTRDQHPALTDGHRDWVWAGVAPGGAWLATGSHDGTARIWDTTTGDQHATLTVSKWVLAAAVAADGTWLATGDRDGTVQIWDAATGQQHAALTGHDGTVLAMAAAPDGSWLATGGQDGTVRIWDIMTGDQRTALTVSGEVLAVAVAADGTWLAAGGSDGSVRIWDAVTGQQHATLTGHDGSVLAMAAAADGTWLATGGQDGTVRIWDTMTGQQRAALKHPVRALTITPDSSWLAGAGSDGTIRIWNPATREISALMRVDDVLIACQWSPRDLSVAVAGSQGVYMFTFTP